MVYLIIYDIASATLTEANLPARLLLPLVASQFNIAGQPHYKILRVTYFGTIYIAHYLFLNDVGVKLF